MKKIVAFLLLAALGVGVLVQHFRRERLDV